jgi:hypothetical protein
MPFARYASTVCAAAVCCLAGVFANGSAKADVFDFSFGGPPCVFGSPPCASGTFTTGGAAPDPERNMERDGNRIIAARRYHAKPRLSLAATESAAQRALKAAGKRANAVRHGGTQIGKTVAVQRRKMTPARLCRARLKRPRRQT